MTNVPWSCPPRNGTWYFPARTLCLEWTNHALQNRTLALKRTLQSQESLWSRKVCSLGVYILESQKIPSTNCQIDSGHDTKWLASQVFRGDNSCGDAQLKETDQVQTWKTHFQSPTAPCEVGAVRPHPAGAHSLAKVAENGLWSDDPDSSLLLEGK